MEVTCHSRAFALFRWMKISGRKSSSLVTVVNLKEKSNTTVEHSFRETYTALKAGVTDCSRRESSVYNPSVEHTPVIG